ncbi:hypothetical protein OnM2_058071 [Erysiphe neolycopersici]|uniref:Uncharacterized protein n=1 Tax=Erysiphe neolycopersici TaxID=212602 RepID=A0A420HQC4_9PEZI|nr:hypothetical protein OnM2_058071 [Erysiphe neolycopersici]
MENAALFRVENVALKEFKAELNDYEHLVELKDDHTPLIKYEWLDDSVHVVIKNPKLETKRSSVESALTSFQDGKKFNFIICIGEQVQLRFDSKVTRKEIEYLLMHILQKNIDYINVSTVEPLQIDILRTGKKYQHREVINISSIQSWKIQNGKY